MITMTQNHIELIMKEFTRRIKEDIKDGRLPNNVRYIKTEIACRMQGVYGTIMAVVPNDNWSDIVWWLDEELVKLYIELNLPGNPRFGSEEFL